MSELTMARVVCTDSPAALPPELLELLIDCTVAAIVAEFRDRGNPDGDMTERAEDAHPDAGLRAVSEGSLGAPAALQEPA